MNFPFQLTHKFPSSVVPPNDRSVVFSGHTHGGIAGIIGFLTLVGLARVPDNGLWKLNHNLLYVHRGQGSRTLMGNVGVRLFIPSEKSVLWLSNSI